MHFVKSMHIAHRSTSWSEHLEFAWKNTCVYENNKYIICKCNTSFPLDLVWSILVTQAECWKKQSTQDMRKWIYVYNDMFVAEFLCFIPYHISQSSACYVYKQYNVYTYTFMYNIYIYTTCISICIPWLPVVHFQPLQDSIGLGWDRWVKGCPDPWSWDP